MNQKQQHLGWIVLPGTTVGGEVGTFSVEFALHGRSGTESRTFRSLVDTGASYSQVPASFLDELGIERVETVRFRLADGSTREFPIGLAEMELEGRSRFVYVVFGTEDGGALLGAMALESFGLAADAQHRRRFPLN
jgi:predicted aspartyl protease